MGETPKDPDRRLVPDNSVNRGLHEFPRTSGVICEDLPTVGFNMTMHR